MKSESGFKTFKTEVFDNIKIKGMYELDIKPTTLILTVNFSLFSSTEAQKNIADFKKKLKQLSLFTIDRHCKQLETSAWKYEGSRFTYEHSLEAIDPKRTSSLGIDLYFSQENSGDILSFYKEICPRIAQLDSFKSNDLFSVQAYRKKKKREKKS